MSRWPVPPAAVVAALLWTLFSIAAYSNAGVDVFETLFGAAAALLWMLVWAARLCAHLWRNRRACFVVSRAGLIYWTFEPAALAAVVALSAGGVFAQARFLASAGALSDYVAAVRAGTIPPQEHGASARRVGLYSVSATQRLDGGAVRFITCSEGLLNAAGFAHSPDGPPPHLGEDDYRPWRGAWYLWRQGW